MRGPHEISRYLDALFMKGGRAQVLSILAGISAGAWLIFTKFIVPPIIVAAYHGRSFSFLNGLIAGQATHPVGVYLEAWDKITLPGLVICLGFWLVAGVITTPAFAQRLPAFAERLSALAQRFVGEATAGSLGAIRMWTCFILLVSTHWEDARSIALLPLEVREPVGATAALYALPLGFERLVRSGTGLHVFQVVTEVFLFLGAIGLWTRVVVPAGLLLSLVLQGVLRDYGGHFWHTNLLPLYLMAILAWTPCGDGWSVDRLWKVCRGEAVEPTGRVAAVYGWSRYACWVAIALVYLSAGLSKLRNGGLFWWSSTNMRSMLYVDNLIPREFDWAFSLRLTSAPDALFALFGIGALIAETCYVLVLFSRRARRIVPVAMMGVHGGILLLQRVLFLDLILLQLVFLDFTAIRTAIGLALRARCGHLQVLYDGFCPLCTRTVRVLASLDLFGRLEFLDFRRVDLTEHYRRHGFTLSDLEASMYVVSRGRADKGFRGYRAIASVIPALWPLVPFLYLPGAVVVGEALYGRVARSRLNLLRCDAACLVPPAEPSCVAGHPGRHRRFGVIPYGLGTCVVAMVLLACWFYRIEFYPFTAWQMYSWTDTTGRVQYYKILSHRESGVTAAARLEDTIGAVAIDGRYGAFLERCFRGSRDVDGCKGFLSAAASAQNRKARPGDKVTAYEVQMWTWDFRSNPSDSQYGSLVERFVYEVK